VWQDSGVNLRDCTGGPAQAQALTEALAALTAGQLVVLPTDTVYGVGAAAANPAAVAALLAAKARGRNMPPPVLIGEMSQLDSIVADISAAAGRLSEALWPGALTMVFRVNPNLHWDLGNLTDTIAVRLPDHDFARQLLVESGPLAVSSANLSGEPAALTAQEAAHQLADNVAVYLDAGPAPGGVPSTVVDTTTQPVRLLRPGAIPTTRLGELLDQLDEGAKADVR
jgi:tRNA threonylcarbamoyl adenosine modification protein (Sua5/YciO/YrdC/YwlC family)